MAFARSIDRGEFNRTRLTAVAQQFEELQHSAGTLAAAGEVSLENFNWWYHRLNALVLIALGEREELRKELLTRATRRPEGITDADRAKQLMHDAAVLKDLVPKARAAADLAVHEAHSAIVGLVLSRFGEVVRRLSTRRADRPPFILNDEHDAQYLLHGLLAIHFTDIR